MGFIEKDVLESPRKHKAPDYYSPASPKSSTKKRKRSPQPTKSPSPRRRIFEEEEESKEEKVVEEPKLTSPEEAIPTPTNVTKRKRTVKPASFTTTALSSPRSKKSAPSTPKRQLKKTFEESGSEVRHSPRLQAKKK